MTGGYPPPGDQHALPDLTEEPLAGLRDIQCPILLRALERLREQPGEDVFAGFQSAL